MNENQNSFKKLIESMKVREDKKIKPVSRTTNNRIESDDDEEDNARAPITRPSTSKSLNCVDLCDSDERSSSPILGAGLPVNANVNHIDTSCSSDAILPSRSCDDRNKDILVDCDRLSSPQKRFVDEPEVASPLKSYPSSPARPLTPNCIITAHSDSDSEASFSILANDGDEPNLGMSL